VKYSNACDVPVGRPSAGDGVPSVGGRVLMRAHSFSGWMPVTGYRGFPVALGRRRIIRILSGVAAVISPTTSCKWRSVKEAFSASSRAETALVSLLGGGLVAGGGGYTGIRLRARRVATRGTNLHSRGNSTITDCTRTC
jgi:hypothetical protein